MKQDTLNKVTADLQERYPDAGIKSIVVDDNKGTSTFILDPNSLKKEKLAFLENASRPRNTAFGSIYNRDAIDRGSLDLGMPQDVYDKDPKSLYKLALRYYYTDPLVGSVVSFQSSVASKGFAIDVGDPDVKNFFINWMFDVDFEDVVEWIFLDLFRTSHVTTYKYVAKYEPKITTVSPVAGKGVTKVKKTSGKELAAKKNLWSKSFLPVGYTVLNPLLVTIDGNLLFDKTSISLTPPQELKDLMSKDASELSIDEKLLLKSLPSDLKKAVKDGGDLLLDSRLVGSVTYKKMPYERYARPRIARVFDSLDYKRALKNADLSTLDGIVNYILKITVGSDEFPVVGPEELEAVTKLFTTESKAYEVVWNHTLQVEKISSPDIEHILGQAKYAQVNDDITAGLAVTRALIDGVTSGDPTWAIRGLKEDIDYARRQVTKWIYKEFRLVSEAMGFDVIPSVRWSEEVLKDEILYKNILAQLVDRRMISYETALETLGYDFEAEAAQMESELELVKSGILGITGSPFQQSANQDTQEAPTGTPSNGRPTGQTNTKEKETDPNKLQDNKVKSAVNTIKEMTKEEKAELIKEISNLT